MVAEVIPLPEFRFADQPTLAPGVAVAIEKAIIEGTLPDGLRLTEEIICRKTGMSRSPIREALRILERDGLVVREPRRGVRVSRLTVENLDELYACRIVLEVLASELAAANATAQEIDAIRRSHQRCERMLRTDDMLGHFRANVEMSQRIFNAAHNLPLVGLLNSIHKQALRYRFLAYQMSRWARVNSVRNNAELVVALAKRDAASAGVKVRQSIELSHEVIRACLMERTERNRRRIKSL
jgi:DNA-binding GntR family transcriptional regulator